jgi:hypothetical protein
MTLKELRQKYGEENVSDQSRGYRTIKKGNKCGIYSHHVERMITGFDFDHDSPHPYNIVHQRGESGQAFATPEKNGKYAYAHVDEDEFRLLSDFIYDNAIDFEGRQRIVAYIDDKAGVVQEGYTELKTIIPHEYKHIELNGQGLAVRRFDDNKVGLFTSAFKPMLPKKITGPDPFVWDRVLLGDKWTPIRFYIGDVEIYIYKDYFKPLKDLPYEFIRKVFEPREQ